MSDTDDIVERLNRHRCVTGIRTVIDDAADEIERLRAERDEARRAACFLRAEIEEENDNFGYDPHTEAEAARVEEEKKRQEERMAKVEFWRGSTDPDVIAKVFPCTRPFTDEEKAEIVRLRANSTPNAEGKSNPPF